MPQTQTQSKADPVVGKYVVNAAGVSYAAPGDPGPIRLAVHHRVIELDDQEAERLLGLGAIASASDEDLAREDVYAERERADQVATGPADNPYGGSLRGGVTLEEHAKAVKDEIAKAHKAAKA